MTRPAFSERLARDKELGWNDLFGKVLLGGLGRSRGENRGEERAVGVPRASGAPLLQASGGHGGRFRLLPWWMRGLGV